MDFIRRWCDAPLYHVRTETFGRELLVHSRNGNILVHENEILFLETSHIRLTRCTFLLGCFNPFAGLLSDLIDELDLQSEEVAVQARNQGVDERGGHSKMQQFVRRLLHDFMD
jgi:hypothetical protein